MCVLRFSPKSVAWRTEICWSRPKCGQAQHVGLQRLDSRQQRREIGGPQREPHLGHHLDPEPLAGRLEPGHHLGAISIVGADRKATRLPNFGNA